jgi:hypothetical protein
MVAFSHCLENLRSQLHCRTYMFEHLSQLAQPPSKHHHVQQNMLNIPKCTVSTRPCFELAFENKNVSQLLLVNHGQHRRCAFCSDYSLAFFSPNASPQHPHYHTTKTLWPSWPKSKKLAPGQALVEVVSPAFPASAGSIYCVAKYADACLGSCRSEIADTSSVW